MLKIIVALKKEVGNLSGYDVYYSGCGKVNATISTMEAISSWCKDYHQLWYASVQ